MMKAIKGITGVTSFLLVLAGLIVSMYETPDLDKQAMVVLMGATIMLIGAGFGFVSMGVSNGSR